MPKRTKANLKVIRKSFGLTLKDFSRLLKIPEGTYKKYEYGERPEPFWLPILIKKAEYEILLKNKNIRRISATLILLLKEYNWNICDIKKLIKTLDAEIKSTKDDKETF